MTAPLFTRKVRVLHIPLPGRFRPLYIMSVIYLGMSFLLRLVLWKLSGPSAGITGADLVPILGAGILNDCVALVFLNIPALLYLTFMPDALARKGGQRIGFALFVFFSLFTLLCLVDVECIFFQKFDARFNQMAVDSLSSPRNLLINVWKSYPVIWIMLVNGVLAALFLFKSWPDMNRAFEHPSGFRSRLTFLAGSVLLIPVLWISTNSFTPSDNKMVNEMAHNGIHSLLGAFRARQLKNLPGNRIIHHDQDSEGTRQQKRHRLPTRSEAIKIPSPPTHVLDTPSDRGKHTDPVLEKIVIFTLFCKGFS